MHIPRPPHSWCLSPRRAIRVQRGLAGRVVRVGDGRAIRLVAGLDAAFSADGRHCLAGVVLWDTTAQRTLEQHTAMRRLRFPYLPGLLSFREAPALLAALRKLEQAPDVLMCDGHGLAHPRRFGIACHLGVITGLPSIGCAKSRLIGDPVLPGAHRGASVPLVHQGESLGLVLRTRASVKPVYVSIGHRIDLATAAHVVLACAVRQRLPEPTRLADRLVAAAKHEKRSGLTTQPGRFSRKETAPTRPVRAVGGI